MKVFVVGSTNPVKVSAVQEAIADLPAFAGASVVGLSVASGVADQPTSLQETYRGAEHRAREALKAHRGATWAIGLEDGMYPCPVDEDRYLNVCVACVIGPERMNFGASSSFMYPPGVVQRVLREGMNVSQALRAEGLTQDANVGSDVGAIGLLSAGRLVRKDYSMQAALTALLPWFGTLEFGG